MGGRRRDRSSPPQQLSARFGGAMAWTRGKSAEPARSAPHSRDDPFQVEHTRGVSPIELRFAAPSEKQEVDASFHRVAKRLHPRKGRTEKPVQKRPVAQERSMINQVVTA